MAHTPGPSMRPLRALAFMTIVFALPLALALFLYIDGERSRASYVPPKEPEIYVVQRGDNLWDIAKSHYGNSVDTRMAVDAIIEANNLRSGGLIWPDQKLILPELGR